MKKTGIWVLVAVVFVTAFFVTYKMVSAETEQEEFAEVLPQIDSVLIPMPTLLYGFPIDSFEIAEGRVKRNQNLSEILKNYNVSYQDIHKLAKYSREVYDVRKLRAGSPYSIIHDADSLKTARQFIFEPNATEFVVYNLVDTIYAELNQKPIEVQEKVLAAEITSSLYNAILDQGGTPVIVNQLVDVFAWQVDFFRIAKGDKFKVIYEQETVDGQAVGVRSIKGAFFEHWSKPYYAIPYETSDKVDFFDEEGSSLRKTLLKAPLNYDRISSRYSLKRFHPVQKRYKAHLGTDYAARPGTPIRTVGDGVVLEARYHAANGNYVKIKHNSNYTTQYLHMSKIASGIRPGVTVKQGQNIGYVGSTGLATGPHLCFRFWKNGKQVDALTVDIPSSSGIEEADLPAFRIVGDSIRNVLDGIPYIKDETLLAKIPEAQDDNP